MRGWERVGRVGDPVEHVLADVPPDSIIALSAYADGPLRCGVMRARDSASTFVWNWPITGATIGDYVFRATAIGENAFRPSDPSAPP